MAENASPTTRLLIPRLLAVVSVTASVLVGLWVATTLVVTPLRFGPLTMQARITFGWPGQTAIAMPPFGSASARTHAGPMRLNVAVSDIDVPGVERLLQRAGATEPPTSTTSIRAVGDPATVSSFLSEETRSLRAEAAALAVSVALVSAAAAFFLALGLLRRWRSALLAGGIALSAVVLSAVLAAATFDVAALAEPRLQGALAYVPRLETVFSTRLTDIERLREQAADVAQKVAAYYADPRSIAAGGGLPGTYRVLHVTDQHLDPVGAELARSLARSYDASLVINTGDIAILGSAAEANLLPSLLVTSTPTVFVPGNHDSPIILSSLRRVPGVTVVESGTIVVDGLRIFAVGDPQSAGYDIEPDRDAVTELVDTASRELRTEQDAGLPAPDIIALHSPVPERAFVGLAPLVLTGHTHSERLYVGGGTVRLNTGTTGGMPYDPDITDRSRLPHSASVLYYTPDLPRRLIAIDRISVTADRTTTLTRHVVEESLLP